MVQATGAETARPVIVFSNIRKTSAWAEDVHTNVYSGEEAQLQN